MVVTEALEMCSRCGGAGRIFDLICDACGGSGRVLKSETPAVTPDFVTAPTAPLMTGSDRWRSAIWKAFGIELPAWVSHTELVDFLDESSSDSSEAPTAPMLPKCSQQHSDFQRIRCFECIAERITALEQKG